jgi:hypothetical protein
MNQPLISTNQIQAYISGGGQGLLELFEGFVDVCMNVLVFALLRLGKGGHGITHLLARDITQLQVDVSPLLHLKHQPLEADPKRPSIQQNISAEKERKKERKVRLHEQTKSRKHM